MRDRTGRRYGAFALVAGVSSLVLVLTAQYAESLRGTGSAWLLNWLDHKGLVRTVPLTQVLEATSPSIWVLTDELAIARLLALGLGLGVLAMLLSIMAEAKIEATDALSLGYVCGAMGLVLYRPLLGVMAMVAGYVAVLLIRQRSGA